MNVFELRGNHKYIDDRIKISEWDSENGLEYILTIDVYEQ